MKGIGFLMAAGAVCLQISAANAAALFDWSYTGTGISGSGTLTAELTATPEVYNILSVSGIANGVAIDSLAPYASPDQILYFSPSAPTHFDSSNPYYFVDFSGFGFASSGPGAVAFNIYEDAFGSSPYPAYSCGAAYCIIGPGDPTDLDGISAGNTIAQLTDFSIKLVDVPEPITLSLFGAGVAGMAALRRRKKTG